MLRREGQAGLQFQSLPAKTGPIDFQAARVRFGVRDWGFMLGWSAVFVAFRLFNVPVIIGTLVTGPFS